MIKYIRLAVVVFLVTACGNPNSETQTVELACGQCQFGLTSQVGCDLAVRMDDNCYFVDGAEIDDFGDAHNKGTGFCEVIRTAEVTGEVVDGRFKVGTVDLKD